MERHKQNDWQGFEHFQDVVQPNLNQLPEIIKPRTSTHKQVLFQQATSKERSHKAPIIFSKPNSKIVKLPASNTVSPERQVNQSNISKQREMEKSQIERKVQQKQEQIKKIEVRRFERIPIFRKEEQCRYSGKVVYKGFVPKTSDNYMRLLKEVDWNNSREKKREIRNLHGIQFNSQFEGGNLNLAIEYDLYMRVDTNTMGHRQWFYFSMRNERKCTVKLHIYRFRKQFSLFQRGMRPFIRSRKGGDRWQAGGDRVFYHYQRDKNENGVCKPKKSFILSFTYTFQHCNDQVFVAAGIPYTYTYLNQQMILYKSMVDHRENLKFQISTLCRSSCGLDLPLITVHHSITKLIHSHSVKKFIIISARTHSGQASGSWVLDGFLMQLGQSQQVEEWMLKQNIWLKIVPMMNPDGVMVGNYRTGIVGDDFNRKFSMGRYQFYPEITGLKKLVASCKKQGQIQLFLDLHGHSVLKNSFIYGPSQAESSSFKMRNLPYHLFHKSKYFRLASCKFESEKERKDTARLFFQNEQKILSYTCQNSLGLFYNQQHTYQMMEKDWQSFGQAILHSMKDIFSNKEIVMPTLKIHNASPLQIKPKIDFSTKKIKQLTSKSGKYQKSFVQNPRTPTLQANQRQGDKQAEKISPLPSLSSQIIREDEKIDIKLVSQERESQTSKNVYKVRRKSQVMKIPSINVVQKFLNKRSGLGLIRVNSQEEQKQEYVFGRSQTYDQTDSLAKQLEKLNTDNEQPQQLYLNYQMQPIPQNFSDQYCSINDSDSLDQDLPQYEKNYIFEYIKQNMKQKVQEKISFNRENRTNSRDCKDAKISRFREIRFRSIQEKQQSPLDQRDMKGQMKKIKLEPHKFKDSTTKSLLNKYNEGLANNNEFDDPSMVSITQQKKLNQRIGNYRRTQKDPFVLIQRRDRQTSWDNEENGL